MNASRSGVNEIFLCVDVVLEVQNEDTLVHVELREVDRGGYGRRYFRVRGDNVR